MAKLLNHKTILSKIFNISEISTEEDFVACTTEIDDIGECKHSGLLICFENELKYFHFDGAVKLTDTIPDNLYFKKLDLINEELVCSFLWHCEKLSSEATPMYGWLFDESYYDSNADYYLKGAKYDITTCVGFCIKVLTGFLENHYLQTSDWDFSTLDSLGDIKDKFFNYLKKIAFNEGISVEELLDKDKLKRILPAELFSSSFFERTPIRKENTDGILNHIENYFTSLKVA